MAAPSLEEVYLWMTAAMGEAGLDPLQGDTDTSTVPRSDHGRFARAELTFRPSGGGCGRRHLESRSGSTTYTALGATSDATAR